MNNILGSACLCIVSVFEIWFLYQILFHTVIDSRGFSYKEKMMVWISSIIAGCVLGINREILFFSSMIFLLVIIVIFICSAWIDKKNYLLLLEIIVFYFSLVALIDYLWAFFSMCILDYSFVYRVHSGMSLEKIIIFFLSRMMVVFLGVLCKKRIKWIENIAEYRMILIIVDIILVAVLIRHQFWMVEMVMNERPIDGITAGISILTMIMIILFFSYLVIKSVFYQKENELLVSKDEMMSLLYQEILNGIDKNRYLIHDFKHHILVLQQYVQQGNIDMLYSYLEGLNGDIIQNIQPVWSGNRIVDFILNQKKRIAESKNIDFTIETTAFLNHPLEDKDICVLLGNLLDNAIEAAENENVNKDWISVRMEKSQNLFFIEVLNSCRKKATMTNGEWVSVKKDKEYHGYGLKSVKRIVKEYDGYITFDVKECLFKVNITFFY